MLILKQQKPCKFLSKTKGDFIMGWWETEYMNTQLIIGDEPLDITNDMINKIVACYQNDLQRKPLLEEILAVTQFTLKFHLEDYVSNGGDKELVEIRAKTKKNLNINHIKKAIFLLWL